MSKRYLQAPWKSGVATSSGATTQVVCSINLASGTGMPEGVALDNCIVYVEAKLVFRNTTTGVGGTKKFARTFKRVSGTLSVVDAAIIPIVDGLLPVGVIGVAYDIAVNSNAIDLNYTGVAATNIEVLGEMRLDVN